MKFLKIYEELFSNTVEYIIFVNFLSTHMVIGTCIFIHFQGNTIAPKENFHIRIPLVFT